RQRRPRLRRRVRRRLHGRAGSRAQEAAWRAVDRRAAQARAALPRRDGAYLDWGHGSLELDVRTTADRDHATAAIGEFVLKLAVPRRVADMFAELGHELLMNAMYDAPVDERGKPK